MASIRLYSGDDGESHIEEIDPSSHPGWTQLHDAKGIVFRALPPGFFSDWHVAPRRQYLITLSGEAEIGLGDGARTHHPRRGQRTQGRCHRPTGRLAVDGTVHRLGPGDVNLAEDLTGRGHTTRVVGSVPRVVATIQLED